MTNLALKLLERRSYELTKSTMALSRLVDAVEKGNQSDINAAMLVARLVLAVVDTDKEDEAK